MEKFEIYVLVVFVIELVVSRDLAVGGGRVRTNTLLRDEFFIILCVGVNLESYWWQTFFPKGGRDPSAMENAAEYYVCILKM